MNANYTDKHTTIYVESLERARRERERLHKRKKNIAKQDEIKVFKKQLCKVCMQHIGAMLDMTKALIAVITQ